MIKESLEKVIEYMKEAEAKHYEESGKPKNHILNDVLVIDEWLNSPSCPLVDDEELDLN